MPEIFPMLIFPNLFVFHFSNCFQIACGVIPDTPPGKTSHLIPTTKNAKVSGLSALSNNEFCFYKCYFELGKSDLIHVQNVCNRLTFMLPPPAILNTSVTSVLLTFFCPSLLSLLQNIKYINILDYTKQTFHYHLSISYHQDSCLKQ